MSSRITRSLYVLLFTVAGALLGFLYAKHRIALSIAYMRAEWGWVCGTGLEFPLYFFTPVGGFAGIIMGISLGASLRGISRGLALNRSSVAAQLINQADRLRGGLFRVLGANG